ncbi:hypothetical protein BSKO_08223 [Bryopsis sp. KO-2023]|nr:hypothetical protein BSKO_08223 [Bryopsis sp. KO-2023]
MEKFSAVRFGSKCTPGGANFRSKRAIARTPEFVGKKNKRDVGGGRTAKFKVYADLDDDAIEDVSNVNVPEGEDESLVTDHDRALKNQTHYAPPDLYDKIKDHLSDDEVAWRQFSFPAAEDDLDEDSEYVTVQPDHMLLGPDETPLEQRVSLDVATAMKSDDVDPAASDYWFSTPEGGWNSEPQRYKKVKETPGYFANAKNSGENRIPLSKFEPGQVLEGEIVEIWLHHGARVDIGCEYDGLIFVQEEIWSDLSLQKKLWPGEKVKVKVYKTYNPEIFRWPIHLEVLQPDIMHLLTPPETWPTPCDLTGKSFEEAMRLSGRPDPTVNAMLPEHEDELTEKILTDVGLTPRMRYDPEQEETLMQETWGDEMSMAASDLGLQLDNFRMFG